MLALSPETEALVLAKAATAGKTPDQIILEALGDVSARPAKSRPAPKKKASLADILAIADRSAARPLLDRRTADEIIGYDAHGIPK